MPELKYTISTEAELAGANSAADALEKQIGRAKALKQDYSELQKQLDTVKASITEYNNVAAKQSALEQEISQRVQAGGIARKKINDQIADSVHTVSQEEIEAATKTADVDTEAVSSKTRIREALHGLGLEFPMLHRVGKWALNEIGLAFASVAGAVAIWTAKLREAREEEERIELPDFQIEQVNQASVAWNGLAAARTAANEAFSSASGIYGRAITELREILELQKQQLEAEKKKALTDLELKKGDMTPEAYAAARGQIEGIFAQAGTKATQTERQQEIARKQEEQANLEIEARNKAAAAGKLPQADPAHEKAAQDMLQKGLAELNDKIAAQKKEVEFLQHYNDLNQNPVKNLGTKEGIAAAAQFGFKYGALADPEAEQKFQEEQLREMQERAKQLAGVASKREVDIAERDRLRKEAETAEQKAREIANELPFDQRSNDRRTASENRNQGPIVSAATAPIASDLGTILAVTLGAFADVKTILAQHEAALKKQAQDLKDQAARSQSHLTQ